MCCLLGVRRNVEALGAFSMKSMMRVDQKHLRKNNLDTADPEELQGVAIKLR